VSALIDAEWQIVGSQAEYLVAVVEDDEGMRQAMRRVLEVAGYKTQLFASAEDFLATDTAAGAKCLVLDVRLPGMSGLDLHRELVRIGTIPAVVFVTAHDLAIVRHYATNVGSAYLAKPFLSHELVEAVGRAVTK